MAIPLVGVGVAVACNNSPTSSIPSCTEESGLALGDTVPGALEAGDRRLAGAYIDYFSLELAADSTPVAVTMTSTDLDPLILIFVEGPDSTSTYQAFDSIGAEPGMEETASWVTPDSAPLPAGCHLIGASSWDIDGSGGYTLSVTQPQ
jgi:hypothetical protein